MQRQRKWFAALAVASVVTMAACGDDDGADVRDTSTGTGASGSGSGSGSGSASGSGSGSGSAIQDAAASGAGTDDPVLLEAVAGYREFVASEVDGLVEDTKAFTDAVRAGDLEEAKAQFAPSRQRWERIEPVASLIPELDGKVDARVDDFSGPDDPTWTGWHRIEYDLWEQGEITDETKAMADQLDADLATLQAQIRDVEIPAAVIAVGASELIEEAANGKLTGEEDRYSRTDLWDIAANVDGSEEGFELLRTALEDADPDLAAQIEAQIEVVDDQLEAYEDGDGYRPFTDVTSADLDAMKASLAELSELMSQVAGALGLS